MFSHHLCFSSNPRESPRRKQIVFDKPPLVLWSLYGGLPCAADALSDQRWYFFSLLSLFLPSSQADMHCRCSLVYPKRAFRQLQSVWFCTLCFIKRIRSCLHIGYICMCASAGCAFDYHAICLASNTVHVYFCICVFHCVFTQRSLSKYINNWINTFKYAPPLSLCVSHISRLLVTRKSV